MSIPKRGRPPGSNSFENFTLEELNKHFPAHTLIPVSKVWLRQFALQVHDKAAAVRINAALPSDGMAPLEVKSFDFSGEGDFSIDD